MFSNRIVVVIVGIACVASAGAGSYFATRQNVAGLASPTAAASSTPAAPTASIPATVPAETATAADLRATAQPPAAAASTVTATGVARPQVRPVAQPPVARPAPTSDSARPIEAEVSTPSAAPAASVAVAEPVAELPASPRVVEERLPAETPKPSVPSRNFEELVVSADSVIGLETESVLSSATARLEDTVEARVVRDVRVGGEVAIPAGTRAIGTVVVVEHGGRFKDRARLGIRFQLLRLADGSELPMATETIYRFGNAPGNASASRIGGGAVVGAIIGGIIGGGKGAAIGATAGAGAGTASVMSSDRTEAVFPRGTEVTARILDPITVTIEKD